MALYSGCDGGTICTSNCSITSITGSGTTPQIISPSVGVILYSNTALYGNLQITGPLIVESGASVSPGASPGTIYTQDVEFKSGSTLSIFIGQPDHSNLVAEDVVIYPGASLKFRPQGTFYTPGQKYDFLSYDRITGEFSQLEMGSVLLKGKITYGASGSTMTLSYNSLTDIVSGSNAQSVGGAIDNLIGSGVVASHNSLQNVIGTFVLQGPEEISSALNQLQPAPFKGLTISQENNAVKVQSTLNYRMQDILDQAHCKRIVRGNEQEKECSRDEKTFRVWGDGFGDILHQKSITYKGSPQVGYQTKTGGVVLGMDGNFAKYCYAGVLGGYTGSTTDFGGAQGRGTIDTGYGGVYFSAVSDMFYANASVIGGWSHFTAHRNIYLESETPIAANTHGGAQILSHLDTGINLGWGGFSVRPFDSFDYISQTENGFTESGAGAFDLRVKKSNAIMLRNELGVQFASCMCIGASTWTVSPKVSWVREVRIKGSEYTASFAAVDDNFTVTGYFPNRSLILLPFNGDEELVKI